MNLYPWSPVNHFTIIFLHKYIKISKMYQNHLIFGTIGLNYEFHNLIEKIQNIYVINIVTLPK
jgi:hypothetical protein